MLTVKQVIQTLPDYALRQAVLESEAWNRSGSLPGNALRGVADRLMKEARLEEEGLLRYTDFLVCREAAKRFVAMGKREESWAIPFDHLLTELIAGLRENATVLSNRAMAAMMVAQMQLGQTPQMTCIGVKLVHADQSKTFNMVSVTEYAELLKRRDGGELQEISVMGATSEVLTSNTAVTHPPTTLKKDEGKQGELCALTARPFREHFEELQSRNNWNDTDLADGVMLSSKQFLSKIKNNGKPIPLEVKLRVWVLLGYPLNADTVMALPLAKY